jgi:hypothetical protein
MVKVRIQLDATLDVDVEAFLAALIEEDEIPAGEPQPSAGDVGYLVAGYFPVEDNVPRWARDAITVVTEGMTVLPVTELPGRVASQCICPAFPYSIETTCPAHGTGA